MKKTELIGRIRIEKVSVGHKENTHQIHSDKRLKKRKTRSAQKREAIKEYE